MTELPKIRFEEAVPFAYCAVDVWTIYSEV